jgi:putative DNA primase/helicase
MAPPFHADDFARLGNVERFPPARAVLQSTQTPSPATERLPDLRTFGLREFAEHPFPKREFVLAPVLPARGLGMLYAQRGVGKTHVALGISLAVASGGSVLRWQAPKPRKVLHVDGEMPGESLQERIARIIASGAMPANDFLRLLPMDAQELGVSINLALCEHQQAVEARIDGHELLVFDNLSTLVNGGRENEAESWTGMQEWLLRLRRRGLSVLLVHHAGRGENARGTSKREDILDTMIHLKRPEDYQVSQGARFEVHLTKARGVHGPDAEPFEAKMEVRDGAATWTTRDLHDVAAERVCELAATGMSVRDIAEATGLSKSTVQRLRVRFGEQG